MTFRTKDGGLKAPFPYLGGKSRVANEIWSRFGDVDTYIEPFGGSLAVLLNRPYYHHKDREIVGDLSCFVANAWRALANDPEAVAKWADYPTSHIDLGARRYWLFEWSKDAKEKMLEDADWYDPKAAGWWIWGTSSWIGESRYMNDHELNKTHMENKTVTSRPHVSGGQGVQQQRRLGKRSHVKLSSAGQGVQASRKTLSQKPNIQVDNSGRGVQQQQSDVFGGRLHEWFDALYDRLKKVVLIHGDWLQTCNSGTMRGIVKSSPNKTCGIFLDPPYPLSDRDGEKRKFYYEEDSHDIAYAVRDWAVEQGKDTRARIALCGGRSGLEIPDDWSVYEWTAGGHRNKKTPRDPTEYIYFSPGCLNDESEGVDIFKRDQYAFNITDDM